MGEVTEPLDVITCSVHGEVEPAVDQFDIRSRICEKCELDRRRKEHVADLIRQADIPLRYRERTFDNYRTESDAQALALRICRAYVQAFDERLAAGGGLVLCGRPGTGKSHLACAIARGVAESGIGVLYVTLATAIRHVRSTWARDSSTTEEEALDDLGSWPLLIVDEVGVQRGSQDEALLTFEIINRRYNRVRPTVLISNLPLAELEQVVGERVIDRMREGGGAVVAFDWPSYRERVADDPALPVRTLKNTDATKDRRRGAVV